MSFINPEINKGKVNSKHPWEKSIKPIYSRTYKYGHNSAKNPEYPPKKDKITNPDRMKFTVIGNRLSKEFIYCMNLVKGLHKYRPKHFAAPVIRGLTSVEWPKVWNDLKIQYGGSAYCLQSQVAIVINDNKFLGGEKELKDLIESKYVFHVRPDYTSEAVKLFANYIKSSGRPCAYLHFAINDEPIGSMIFMLYADIVPRTCENFLYLCTTKKGGYSGTPVHRIVRDGWIQCGGFGMKNTEMDCENFIVPHDRRGVICMANAGRHLDCSTQFFVLLQPAPWMAHKYVAFGQLIEGEDTLQKIENVPIWYEAPTKEINIFKSGVLNLECKDFFTNKRVNQYIEGHIEDLYALGELFYEALLEKVFVEVDLRSTQRLQEEIAGEDAEVTPEEAAKNLHATQRFMRKKEEIDKQLEKSHGQAMSGAQSGRSTPATTAADKGNNEFDVEEYTYEPEEYSYKHVSLVPSATEVVKPKKPFYIPLTDVPYPGEVDSTYDLKKLLKGDYCLESDIDRKAKKKKTDDRLSFPSQLFDALFDETPSIGSVSQETLDSEDEKEIMAYLKQNADRVSFAGGIIKTMAKGGKFNLFENQRRSEMITDEALRRFRLVSVEIRSQREKAVSISLPSPDAREVHKEIKRRQTGFVRPEDLTRIRSFKKERDEDDESDEDDEDDIEADAYRPFTRKAVSTPGVAAVPEPEPKKKKSKGRQTFHDTDELEKVHVFHRTSSDKHIDDNDNDSDSEVDERVHIAAPPSKGGKVRRPTAFVRPSETPHDDFDDDDDDRDGDYMYTTDDVEEVIRPSVLTRLLDTISANEALGPTLKDYKPYSETRHKNTLFLTASPTTHIMTDEDSREKFKHHKVPTEEGDKTIDQVLNLQHGKKVARKISSDYVKTIDHIEHKIESSIRSVEYAKTRPSMSVVEYQRRNQQYQEKLAKSKVDPTFLDVKENFT